MSTLAPTPLHHARLHVPSPRHLSQLGFLAGAGAGVLSWLAAPHVVVSMFVFALVWYGVSYGLGRVAAHPERRLQWTVHVLLLPVVGVAVALALGLGWPHHLTASVLLGFVGAVAAQAALTQTLLRGVVADRRYDVRRRAGIE